jgi:hypothetical protein
MSKYLPIENIEYKTRLSRKEVFQKLHENIEIERSFGFLGNNTIYSKPYIGIVNDHYFKIKRAISYRNSFLPEITGEILEQSGNTRIKVNMKPVSFVIAFMIVWFGGVCVACIAVAFAAFSGRSHVAMLVPFGMLLFGIVLMYGGFKTESKRSINDLKEILKAEVV